MTRVSFCFVIFVRKQGRAERLSHYILYNTVMIMLKECPICGNGKISNFEKIGLAPHVDYEIMPKVMVNAAIVSRYSVCSDCGIIFQNPRLSDSELDMFYGQGYYRQLLNMTQEQIDADELFRAKTDAEIIRGYFDGDIGSHLDVGCSRGNLLTELGTKIKVGVESNVDYVKENGIKVFKRLDQVPNQTFDLVSAIHVLEHESNPIDYLKSMAEFVKSGGLVAIEVPTWSSPGGPLRLPHLYHFEPEVLKRMCEQTGLTVLHEHHTPHLMLVCKSN